MEMTCFVDAIFSRYDPPDFEKIYDHTLMYDNNNRSGKNQFNSYSRMPSEIMDFNGLYSLSRPAEQIMNKN